MIAAIADKCSTSFSIKNEALPLPEFSMICWPQEVIHIWKADGIEGAVNSYSNPFVCLENFPPFMDA